MHAELVQGRWARGWMLLGNQHPPLPWQPPHPSWDAARPDDEVIRGGERGRQAGSGDLLGPGRHPNLLATVTHCTRKAGAAHAGHPPHPCTGAGGRLCRSAFSWWRPHGACRSTKIPAVPGRAVLTQAHSFQMEGGLGYGNWGAPTGRPPQTGAMAGPRELKNKGKAGGCLNTEGASLCPPATHHPLDPQQQAADNDTNKIDFNPHILIPLIGRPSRRRIPAWSRQSSCKALSAMPAPGRATNTAPACNRGLCLQPQPWPRGPAVIPQEWGWTAAVWGSPRPQAGNGGLQGGMQLAAEGRKQVGQSQGIAAWGACGCWGHPLPAPPPGTPPCRVAPKRSAAACTQGCSQGSQGLAGSHHPRHRCRNRALPRA